MDKCDDKRSKQELRRSQRLKLNNMKAARGNEKNTLPVFIELDNEDNVAVTHSDKTRNTENSKKLQKNENDVIGSTSFAEAPNNAKRLKVQEHTSKIKERKTEMKKKLKETVEDNPKKKYHRYIQKKFSPQIFSNCISMMSETRKVWVKQIGFTRLLEFGMKKYPHHLGYNVVEAFDRTSCSLQLKSGNVLITEGLVHEILGLPNGLRKIELVLNSDMIAKWADQFKPVHDYHITPSMVSQKICEGNDVTDLFKMNFLVLVYNFMFKSQQNAYVNREILGFKGDFDKSSEYNWCQLLITKLLDTHAFWSEDPDRRHFAGPLPFLIYVYIDMVGHNQEISRKDIGYLSCLDKIMYAREKFDEINNGFGLRKNVNMSSQADVTYILTNAKKTATRPATLTINEDLAKKIQVPDELLTKCKACGSDLNAFMRMHNCINCGDIFCDKCTHGRIALTADENAPKVPVCDLCMDEVTQRLTNCKEVATRSDDLTIHENLTENLQVGSRVGDSVSMKDGTNMELNTDVNLVPVPELSDDEWPDMKKYEDQSGIINDIYLPEISQKIKRIIVKNLIRKSSHVNQA